ncbi:hypothetical protein Tco_1219692 [Tanacetum coccineum]
MHIVRGDGVAGIKRRCRDQYGDGVRNLATASRRGRLKEDLESSTWRRRQDFKATPSQRFFYMYTQIDINYAAGGNLRGLSAKEAWETIEDYAQCDLDMMEDKVENQSPQSTLHVLPSFEVYTPLVTYPKEVEETLGTPMEEEPLDQTKLEDVGLTNHNISLSYREVPSLDEPKPQPQPLHSCPSFDVSLARNQRGPEPPIKPHSPNSFRIKDR